MSIFVLSSDKGMECIISGADIKTAIHDNKSALYYYTGDKSKIVNIIIDKELNNVGNNYIIKVNYLKYNDKYILTENVNVVILHACEIDENKMPWEN